MELEELIKKYPEGVNFKTISLTECNKLESLLESSLSTVKPRLPKLAPFLVASLLQSEQMIVAAAISNVGLCIPHIQQQLQEVVLKELSQIQIALKSSLEDPITAVRALQVWKAIIKILGVVLHKNRVAVNTLLIIPEKAFKSQSSNVQKHAFIAWKDLIDNFALSSDIISNSKRLKLILQPLLSCKSKSEDVLVSRCDTWWHLASRLEGKLTPEFDKVCIPLLKAVFQIPASSTGRISTSSEVDGVVLKSLQLRASEIIIRIFEQSNVSSPGGLTSPKKVADLGVSQLTASVPNMIIAKNSEFLLNLAKRALQFLNGIHPGSPLSQMLLQVLILRMNTLSKDQDKDEVQAVSHFIHFIRMCIKETLTPSGLKLLDDVTRLLPSKVLTSHCYHQAMNSTEVMNGVPALAFLELLLSDSIFSKNYTTSNKLVSVFNRLINVGLDETDFYLSFAQTVLERLKDLCNTGSYTDVLLNLWTHTGNALWKRVQKTQDVNQGDTLEHDFSCLLNALVLPLRLQLNSTTNLRTKEVERCWNQLCKAFLRCAALVKNTEANIACEELSIQMLIALGEEPLKNPLVLTWLTFSVGTIIGAIDFQAFNSMPNAASVLQSPERWRKRLQQPLGNVTSVITLLSKALLSIYPIICEDAGKTDPLDTFFTDCLQHVKHIFSNSNLSSLLLHLAAAFAPSLIPFYNKSNAKKLSPHYKKLEQTWQAIVNCFTLHFKGPHSQESFDTLHLYLEPTLLYPYKAIQERARSLWQAAFAEIYNTLSFPDSFKTVLKQVKPPLIPGGEISSVDTETSLEHSCNVVMELPVIQKTPTRRKSLMGELQSEAEKDSFLKPKSTSAKGSKLFKSKEKNKSQEFVKIIPQSKPKKLILTEHQKEVKKQKKHLPAMYNDLSQDTQLSQDSQLEDSNSLQISTTVDDVDKEVPKEKCDTQKVSEVSPASIQIMDISSSETSSNFESSTLESNVPLIGSPIRILGYNSDDSQLSGTDSPVLLPCGISSKDVKMPKRVKRDSKLKSPTDVVLERYDARFLNQSVNEKSSVDSSLELIKDTLNIVVNTSMESAKKLSKLSKERIENPDSAPSKTVPNLESTPTTESTNSTTQIVLSDPIVNQPVVDLLSTNESSPKPIKEIEPDTSKKKLTGDFKQLQKKKTKSSESSVSSKPTVRVKSETKTQPVKPKHTRKKTLSTEKLDSDSGNSTEVSINALKSAQIFEVTELSKAISANEPAAISEKTDNDNVNPIPIDESATCILAHPNLSSSEKLLTEIGEKSESPIFDGILETSGRASDTISTIEIESTPAETCESQPEACASPNIFLHQLPEAQEKMVSMEAALEVPIETVNTIEEIPEDTDSQISEVSGALNISSSVGDVSVVTETEPQNSVDTSEKAIPVNNKPSTKIINFADENVDGKLEVSINLEERLQDVDHSVVILDTDAVSNDQLDDQKIESTMVAKIVSSEQPDESSQVITEYSSEEIDSTPLRNARRKRKAVSPVRTTSNKRTETLFSRNKLNDSKDVKCSPKRMSLKRAPNKSILQDVISISDDDEEVVSDVNEEKGKENIGLDKSSTDAASVPVFNDSMDISKQSPISASRKRPIRTSALSPLSRSHRLVQAARKSNDSSLSLPSLPLDISSLKELHSPPNKRSKLHVYSPLASPSNGILKVKSPSASEPSPSNGQKRRVSFADPPVQEEVVISSSTSEVYRCLEMPIISEGAAEESSNMDGSTDESTVNVVGESDDSNVSSQDPIFPELMKCSECLQPVLAFLTSGMWTRGLEQLLLTQNIKTIGELSSMTCHKVQTLPIQQPKVKNLRAALAKYNEQINKSRSPAESDVSAIFPETEKEENVFSADTKGTKEEMEIEPKDIKISPLVSQEEPTQLDNCVIIYDPEEENSGNVELSNLIVSEAAVDTAEAVADFEVEDLCFTQKTSSALLPQDDDDEEPLPCMDTVLEDDSIMQTSMLCNISDPTGPAFINDQKMTCDEFPSVELPDLDRTHSNFTCLPNVLPLDTSLLDVPTQPSKTLLSDVLDILPKLSVQELLIVLSETSSLLTMRHKECS